MVDAVLQEFKKQFQGTPVLIQSPGRVNLIGEHTDYNDGLVLPAAIEASIWFAIAPSKSKNCKLYAMDRKEDFEFQVDDITNTQSPWGMYIKGVTSQLIDREIGGFDCVFGGNIPQGAGLSSSAALTCGIAFSLDHIFDLQMDRWEMVEIAQLAEHRYAKVNCGMMDQFANLFSKKDSFSKLDCQNLSFEQAEWKQDSLCLLLIDTKVTHSLASTEYNIRKQDCDMAVSLIQSEYPNVSSLRDVDAKILDETSFLLGERLIRRASYVMEENDRVEKSFNAIQKGDHSRIGQLLYESHKGLSEKFSVSCDELDFLVNEAESMGVLGARMMGGGFGGCTLNLLLKDSIDEVQDKIKNAYNKSFGRPPEFYKVSLSEGTRIL